MSNEPRHTKGDLAQMQSLPLEAKIRMTQLRIRDWYEHFEGQVYVSFSGGKDSTVLKHIVDNCPGVYDVPAVFVNTGLEYPEIQRFVKDVKSGKFDCFNSNVVILRPEMRFDEVIKKYGYPVISKAVSNTVHYAKQNIAEGKDTLRVRQMLGVEKNNEGGASKFNKKKWQFLLDAPFDVHNECCRVMKKKPFYKYEEETGRKPLIATMTTESSERKATWEKYGCNAFDKKHPSSQPLSFWTEQDVLYYLKKYNVPYCSVYGEIRVKQPKGIDEGQINAIDYLGLYEPEDILETTGCYRTGCIFCAYGCHEEKNPNRFQRMKETHPRQYEYCIGGGELVDGKWKPNKEGLGLGHVLDYIGVKYD